MGIMIIRRNIKQIKHALRVLKERATPIKEIDSLIFFLFMFCQHFVGYLKSKRIWDW